MSKAVRKESVGKASATGGKERKVRSRAACGSCKSTKQRCDGPNIAMERCRRCELYSLECVFPASSGPLYCVPQKPRALPTAVAGPSTTLPRINTLEDTLPPNSGRSADGNSQQSDQLTQKLYEIATRLQSIEGALHLRSYASPTDPSRHQNLFPPSPDDADYEMESDLPPLHSPIQHQNRRPTGAETSGHTTNGGASTPPTGSGSGLGVRGFFGPLQECTSTMERILGKPEIDHSTAEYAADYGAPDALRRGILNPEECQELFDFFFRCMHPWVMMLSYTTEKDAMAVRQRSPLLFHTILLLATSYSPSTSNLHSTLNTFLNAIIAPQLLSPQPHELNADFLRAVDLLNIYKPVQFAARRAEGLGDAEAMLRSKVNGNASFMLQGILARTADRIQLSSCVAKFLKAYASGWTTKGVPIPESVVGELRLFFWLLSNDAAGNCQSGKMCNMVIAPGTLNATRLFAELRLQPFDVRLAASVEMFEVSRPILRSSEFERTRRINKVDLRKYNDSMLLWEQHWVPILLRELPVDTLALTPLCPFSMFLNLIFNGSVFTGWKATRYNFTEGEEVTTKEDASAGVRGKGGRALTAWEKDSLQRCVDSAEALIFFLSEESREKGAWRKVQWEKEKGGEGQKKLTLDEAVIESHKWAPDAITVVAFYFFPLLFACQLHNEGLLTPDLVLLSGPVTPFLRTQKLPRLLELGAAYLEAISYSTYHPARNQASVLRALLEAGVRGPTTLPRNAVVVLSPAPEPSYSPASGEGSSRGSTHAVGGGGGVSGGGWNSATGGPSSIYSPHQSTSSYPYSPHAHLQHLPPPQSHLAHFPPSASHQQPQQQHLSNSSQSIQQQRYQLQMAQMQMNSVLEGVDFSVLGESSEFWTTFAANPFG